ncbi:MAG: Chlorophyll a synthase ChlG, partial [uncultured Acetobacteraceae bacterium]
AAEPRCPDRFAAPLHAGAVGGVGVAEARHLVPAGVGLRLRRGVVRSAARGALAARARGLAARGAGGLRHEPSGQRLVRPARGRGERARPPHPLGARARPLGPVDRAGLDRPVVAPRPLARSLGGGRHRRRRRARLGLQRAAAPAEAERLVGQHGRRRLLRGAALDHRCRGDGGRRAGRPGAARGRALQRRRARHHDLERLQVGRGRPALRHRLPARPPRPRARGPRRLRGDGRAAGGRRGVAAPVGRRVAGLRGAPSPPCAARPDGAAAARSPHPGALVQRDRRDALRPRHARLRLRAAAPGLYRRV